MKKTSSHAPRRSAAMNCSVHPILAALMLSLTHASAVVSPAAAQSRPGPQIGVSPDSLSATLFTGAVARQNLLVRNLGDGDLSFSVLDQESLSAAPPALEFLANVDYPGDASNVWGYSAPDGTELAIIGHYDGTSFVEVSTDPTHPREVAFIPGPQSIWREIKTYGHYAYIVTEGGGGLQIVDMANPQQPVLAATYSSSFSTAHTIFIDEAGFAYIMGSNTANGGLHMLNLANPTRPTVAGNWTDWYVHDGFGRDNVFYAASIGHGTLDFIDVSNKSNPILLQSLTYPNAFTHSAWLTEDSKYALTTDERVGGFLNIWNIENLNAIELAAQYRVNPNHIPHNVHVRGQYAYLSAYVDGVVILEISNPAAPMVAAHYDTYPGGGGTFSGAWGVYPYARHGLVYVSDIQTGLYVLRFGSDWLREAPASGLIPAAGSAQVAVTFDAHGLAGGEYFADILISSNDAQQPVVKIPAHLRVTGVPDIALSDSVLDFGAVFIPGADTLTLAVANLGVEPLQVFNVSADHPNFTATPASFSVAPGQQHEVAVRFGANSEGDFSGSLSVQSNDPDEPLVKVAVHGRGVRPPDIAVIPDSLREALFTGETAAQTLTVVNNGFSELSFEVSVQKAGAVDALRSRPDNNAAAWQRKPPPAGRNLDEKISSFGAKVRTGISSRFKNPYDNLAPLPNGSRGRRLPGTNARPSSSQRGALFAVDGGSSEIVELNPATGDLVNVFSAPGGAGGPDGLAYDGEHLYFKGSASDTLYKIDKNAGQVIDRAFIAPGLPPIDGLAHSGEALYALAYSTGEIYRLDFEAETVVDQVSLDFAIGGGITFAGSRGTLFVADFGTFIYEIDPEDWTVKNSFALSGTGTTLGLGYSEGLGLLFTSNTSDGTIYAIDPDDGANVYSFSAIGFLTALAADEAFGVSWLSLTPSSGIVPAGGAARLTAAFDASGLDGGEYFASVVITSNDPDQPVLLVPAHLSVTGAPDIAASADSINFGVKFVGYGGAASLVIANEGTDVLNISSITIDKSAFSVSPTSLALAPRTRATFTVSFLPAAEGNYRGTMSVLCNDPDESVVTIVLAGSAIAPPIAGVTPDSLSASLFAGDSTQQTIRLTNTGGSDLVFDLGAVEVASPAPQQGRDFVVPKGGIGHSFPGLRNFWQDKKAWPGSSAQRQGGSAPAKTRGRAALQAWRLLYTDPDEAELTYDIRRVYGAVASNEVLFKLESQVSWSDPAGNGITFMYIDADQDTATGVNTEQEENALGWFLGIDYAIIRVGDQESDGLYQWNDLIFEFEKIDELTTNTVPPNSNEIIVGVNSIHFRARPGINFAMDAGSFSDPGADQVPDLGAGHITFALFPRWLRLNPQAGTLPAGGLQDIAVTFDATQVFGGAYLAHIVVASNDPARPELEVATHLSVTGIPAISIATDTVDFATSFAGYKDSTYLKITNTGTDLLIIDNTAAGDPRVTLSPRTLALRPLASDSLTIYLLAENPGPFASAITFTTNDPQRPAVALPVKATVVIAPNAAVTPAELLINVAQGGTATDTLVLANNGGSTLEFSTRISYESMGQALQLDGMGDGLSVQPHTALNLQNSLTLELWVRPIGIRQNFPRLISKGAIATSFGNFGAYEIALDGIVGQGTAGPAFATLVDANTREPFFVFSSRQIELNTWTHLATTYDGTNFRIYVNGQLDGENFFAATAAVNNQILSLGKWFSGNFNSFWGEIDEVRIWNLARTPEQIQQQMFSPLQGSAPGLVGYWRFDADPFDASPFKHGVTLIGDAKLAPSTSPVQLNFLRINPAAGTVPLNRALPLAVTAAASFLTQGQHHATIILASNDPDQQKLQVPVTVQVGPPVSVEENPNALPTVFALAQNYPNPFNPETAIRYALPVASEVQFIIYDLHGREVIRLIEGQQPAGYHLLHWNGRDRTGAPVASGVYLYRLTADRFSEVKKAVLLR